MDRLGVLFVLLAGTSRVWLCGTEQVVSRSAFLAEARLWQQEPGKLVISAIPCTLRRLPLLRPSRGQGKRVLDASSLSWVPQTLVKALNSQDYDKSSIGAPARDATLFFDSVTFSFSRWGYATNQKLNCQINRLLSCCKAHSDDGLHLKETDAFDICVSFIEESQHMFPKQLRQEAVIIVKRIVLNSLGCAKQKETHGLDTKVSEEVIYLAAVLRLMGSSFLEILNCLRKMRVEDGMQHQKFTELCISETIRLLGQYEANGLHRDDLFGRFEKPVDREMPLVLMLFHVASLLVFCLRMRFGFLWKGCIIMLMMTMNLVIDQERSMSAFQFLIASKDSATPSIHQQDSLKVSVPRKSIASQFNNLRKLRVGGDRSLGTPQRCKSRDGRAIFELIPGYKQNSSEWDDLVDFVECDEDVDYSSWFMQRAKFKQYKDTKWKRSKRPSENSSKIRELYANKSERRKTSR
ncbi:uncharacterized protein LOC124697078 [Lolium rigidum]|uniref:uncharacterized protein LOC124697078 n=1 Tax=Lolium rigidum TaxID=89674 RepID=UPI001F5DA1A7|nr:uncharacterized protein LOC124697078 [Lolium rigidum]